MSIKKELLNELTEFQLKQLAETKGIIFSLNTIQKKYYENWAERDKLVDLMSENKHITVSEIERFIHSNNAKF
jgi:Tfp pilus assembly major pilin PilA